ncbi:MAG: IS1380 family transposase, partial [Rhodobacteraceae bacterium]|nr:IS1380 family transposase [Paracoccaceae bacterium]
RFPPISGFSIRGDFHGGALSSDFGPILLRGVDQQIGLIDRLAGTINDRRHLSYIDHPLPDLLAQRIFQVACGYEDGNDANSLRQDPMFKLALERKPLDANEHLASGPTFSRLENAVTPQDMYRMAQAFVDQFIQSYSEAPSVIVLDMDHSEDPTHGQQQLALYNHHYRNHCYLPLFLFEGLSGKLITAALRPGKRPSGAENASILKRVIKHLRRHWPQTHIVLRGDGHFANPELMRLVLNDPHTDFIFGLPSNAVLARLAQPVLEGTRELHRLRC